MEKTSDGILKAARTGDLKMVSMIQYYYNNSTARF